MTLKDQLLHNAFPRGINGIHHGKAFDIDSGSGYVAAVSYAQDAHEITLLTYGCITYQTELIKRICASSCNATKFCLD